MNIAISGLTVRYGAQVVVSGLSLDVAAGEVMAVVGPNGSGKSSLLRALAGLVRHDGRVAWDGQATVPPADIGYMPQDNAVRAALTVFEVVLLGRLRSLSFRVARTDLDAATAVLAELGLARFADRRIGALSGGQRQLVFLAQVLAGDPRVLLLDEPTSALDIAHQFQVLDLLRDVTCRRGLTAVVVLHDLNAAARYADRVALLQGGCLVAAGSPHDVLCADRLSATFGAEVATIDGPDGRPVVVPLRRRAMPS
jgi:iron complex transport system ATP-binding protein